MTVSASAASHQGLAAAALLVGARRVVVVTGSGMSQESGIATFRDAREGLWARYDPEELATPQAFAAAPARVFGWYLQRWRTALSARPHEGHVALARLAHRFERLVLVTQNVDGLHHRAGSPEVIELHGSLGSFRCSGAGHPYEAERLSALEPDALGGVEPPRCDRCGTPIRPGVVWFGEPLPQDAVRQAWHAASAADAMLVVGTSGLVHPAAELPLIARQAGAKLVEINPNPTPFSGVADLWWPETARDALPQLLDALVGPPAA